MKKILLLPLVVMAVLLTGCGYNIPSDMIAVHETKGGTQARKVVGCEPSSTRAWWTNDHYPVFPTSEREWDATGQKDSDAGRFTSVTKDNVIMRVPVTIRFTLRTDCPTLKDFYVKYARRYGVEFQTDGTYNQAWLTVLRKLVADPADQTLDRIVQDYNWRDVWNNPQVKTEIEKRMNDALQSDTSLLVQTAHKSYFENITVLIGGAQPANPDLASAVATEQTNVAKAQSAEAQAKADRAKALAEVAVAQAEAEKKQAEIKGYGSPEVYICLEMAKQGLNCKQPTYVVSGTAPAK